MQYSIPSNKIYHGFLTHNWAKDEEGRNNHNRVERVHKGLKKRGLNTWFDSERMQGAIVDQMIKGIDESDLVIVFLTKKYADKVASRDPKDNCKKEFDYTSRVKGANKMIPVPMEPCMCNPRAWIGPVQMELGGMLYEASFPTDDAFEFEQNLDKLFEQIVRETGAQAPYRYRVDEDVEQRNPNYGSEEPLLSSESTETEAEKKKKEKEKNIAAIIVVALIVIVLLGGLGSSGG